MGFIGYGTESEFHFKVQIKISERFSAVQLHRLIYNLERSPWLPWRPVEIRRADDDRTVRSVR